MLCIYIYLIVRYTISYSLPVVSGILQVLLLIFQIGYVTCLFVLICPVVPFGATSIIHLDDFAMFWLACAFPCAISTDIWDPMS